ncbi:MAG TPA: DUF6065 family protein [Allosphingosinicella sp.]
MPLRARQHCLPFSLASGWGYHVHSPINFKAMWDGKQIFWNYGDVKGWLPLNTAYLPNSWQRHSEHAPAGSEEFCPIFLEAFPEPGVMQIWSGYVAQTPQDWSLLVRSPINLPGSSFYEVIEGIIETDWWVGPLVTFIRFTKTDVPVKFRRAVPLFQVAPLPRGAYSFQQPAELVHEEPFSEWSEADWDAFRITFEKRNSGKPGDYARYARKRPPPEAL